MIVDGKNYLTPGEAASLLSIHLSTVYSWCTEGQVNLLDSKKLQKPVNSKYLIEESSLRAKHAEVYLGE